MVLLELLIVLVLVALAGWGMATVSRRRRASLERWRVEIRALQSGTTAVELVREGSRPQRIALLDPADDEFTMKLEEARATAIDRASALNTAHQGLPS